MYVRTLRLKSSCLNRGLIIGIFGRNRSGNQRAKFSLSLIKISEISIICSLRKSENFDLLLKLFRNTATFEKENPFREIPEKNGKILRRLTSLSENWFVEGIHSLARLLFAEEEGRGGGRVARGVAPIKIGMERADGKTLIVH